jgi:hypothetical protein
MTDALEDLTEFLESDEQVESVVFGDWGWGGFSEPDQPNVSKDLRGKVLNLEKAAPYMRGWSFYGGYGSPDCYAVYVWTNKRVIWVTQYDGSTSLSSAPRNPVECEPEMPGG